MPEIPLINERRGYPDGPATPQRTNAWGETLIREGGNILDKAVEFKQRLDQARRAAESGRLQFEATRELNALQQELEKSPEYEKQPQLYWDGAQKIRDKYSKLSEDSLVIQDFQEAYDKVTVSREPSVLESSWKKEKDARIAHLDYSTEEYAKDVANTPPGPEREAILDVAEQNIIHYVYGGFVSREEGQKRLRQLHSRADEIEARQDIMADPETAFINLIDPQQYSSLEPLTRQQLTEAAQRAMEADLEEQNRADEKAEREAEKQRKEAQTVRENEVLGQIDQGSPPSLAELNEMATGPFPEISQEGYHYLRDRVLGLNDDETVTDDYQLQNEIFELIFDGNYQAARELIYSSEGSLKPSTQRSLLNTVRTASEAGGKLYDDVQKAHLDFVRSALGVRPLIQLTDDRALLVARAELEFMERVAAGEDSRTVADDLVKRYSQVGIMKSSVPKPRFGPEPKNSAEIDALAADLLKRREAGEIDEPTYNREIRTLQLWDEVLTNSESTLNSNPQEGSPFR